MDNLTIKFYKVKCGDCIYLRYTSQNEVINIFIDAGYSDTYKTTFRKDVKKIVEEGEKINLFVITHIDQDHISGVKPFLKEYGVKIVQDFWFNHSEKFSINENAIETEVSVKQGMTLRNLLQTNERELKEIIAGAEYYISGISIKILSPTIEGLAELKNEWQEEERKFEFEVSNSVNDYHKTIEELLHKKFNEDDDPVNGSSIAFLLEIDAFKAIFSADAHPSILYDSLIKLGYSKVNPLKLDLFKVPHHGSKRNLSSELLEIIDCQNFVFSANGINRDNLPTKEILAQIVQYSKRGTDNDEILNLYFNYDNERLRSIATIEERRKYKFECLYAQSNSNCLKIDYEIVRKSK